MRGWAYAVVGLMACSPRGVTVGGDEASAETATSTDPGWEDESSGTGMRTDLPPECGSESYAQSSSAHVAWVVEQSSAMRAHAFDHDATPDTPDRTAWRVAIDLINEFGSYYGRTEPCGASIETSFSFAPALEAQPIPDPTACQLAAPPLPAFNRDIHIAALTEDADAMGNGGANPLALAHEAAVERLLEGSHESGDYVVLVVHTPPNCGEGGDHESVDPRLLASVQEAVEAFDIPTYVVGVGVSSWDQSEDDGIPDLDARSYFGELAEAGGRDKFFQGYWNPDIEFLSQFDWGEGVSGCVLAVDPPVPEGIDEASIRVFADGERVDFSDAGCLLPEGESGWVWVHERDTIQICGDACSPDNTVCHPTPPHVRRHFEVRWSCP